MVDNWGGGGSIFIHAHMHAVNGVLQARVSGIYTYSYLHMTP